MYAIGAAGLMYGYTGSWLPNFSTLCFGDWGHGKLGKNIFTKPLCHIIIYH